MAVKTPIAMVPVLLAVLAFSAAPALAAAPEAPELTVETLHPGGPTPATSATFLGVLNPKAEGEPGNYVYVYKAGPSCAGGTETTPLEDAGSSPQPVTEVVTGLAAKTAYTVCLRVTTLGGTSEAEAHFETALAPETPNTLKAEAVAGTTATLNGELNPKAKVAAKDGYYFTYGSGGTCEGFTSTPGAEATGTKIKVSTPVSELEGSTEYTFCVVETNAAGETATGGPLKFKTSTAKPVILSETAPTVTPVGATLEAKVNPEKQETTYRLEYSTEEAKVEKGEGTPLIESAFSGPGLSEAQTVGPVETGTVLTPFTTYYYRVVTANGTGTEDGKVEEFTTGALEVPKIYSEGVTAVTQTNAELHATINPEFQKTSFQFELGESSAYGLGPLPAVPANLRGALDFSGELPAVVNLATPEETKLKPSTEYHYEVLATNATGTVEGASTPGDQTFLTLPDPPIVSTGKETSSITADSATISVSVNPGSSAVGIANPQGSTQDDTVYYVEYGASTSYGKRTPSGDAGEGTSAQHEAVNLEGLAPGTTYHYRVVASNLNNAQELNEGDEAEYGGGLKPQVVYGEDETFPTTSTPPILTGVSAQGVTQTGATIVGTLDPQSLPSRWELQVGATQGQLQPVASGGAFSTTELSLPVGSLSPGTTYYYRLIATNASDRIDQETNQPVPVEFAGSFMTAPASAGAAPPGLPALLTYQSIAELTAKEAKENKELLKAEKLKAALKRCKKDKRKSKRASCVRHARKEFG